MLVIDEVAKYLLNAGLLSSRDIVTGKVEITSTVYRNQVFVLTCSSRNNLWIKTPAIDRNDPIARLERRFYRHVLSCPEAFDGLVPSCILSSERDATLVLALLEGYTSVDSILLQSISTKVLTEVGTEIGSALATFHRCAQGFEAHSSIPWVFDLAKPSINFLASASRAHLQIINIIQTYLSVPLEQLRSEWSPTASIHGDVKRENIMIRHASVPFNIRLVDFETVQRGDPAWDIGGALQSFLKLWAAAKGTHQQGSDSVILQRIALLCKNLVTAYLSAGEYIKAPGLFRRRCIAFAGLRLIQTVYEGCHFLSRVPEHQVQLLQLAYNLIKDPARAWRALMGGDVSM
jgi:hypothetical protein